ncbi:hypothetical protein [Acinetobacter sp. AS167]|uniref:hypothetical protein n=1 Tax=Acinetobacter sp. AS167 TaxID=3127884 RepID=UPI0030190845
MFSSASLSQLSKMKVDIMKYQRDLQDKFDKNISYFDKLISELNTSTIQNKKNFLDFCDKNNISVNEYSELYNCLYEMFTNICLFNTDGLLGLFQGKQAEWGTLKVTLSKEDFPKFNNDIVHEETIIYRGMSEIEFEKKDFTQHWTTDLDIARKFAFDTYSDSPRGIVVCAKIDKDDVIYYECNSHEKEIIPIVRKIKDPVIFEK